MIYTFKQKVLKANRRLRLFRSLFVLLIITYITLFAHESFSNGEPLKPPRITLDDVFICIRTSKLFHKSRLPLIIKTWFQLAKEQIWIFTDTDDAELQNETNGHMITTNCPSSHGRWDLCCKMSRGFDMFLDTNKKWWCHFDDDNYVNVPRLVHFLGDYSHVEDWYLGKPSLPTYVVLLIKKKKVRLRFATGGAGICLSRTLAMKMIPIAGDGKFIWTGEAMGLPDDVSMAYIIEYLLKTPLTIVHQFHSHLESMRFIRRELISDQISFSYSLNNSEWNIVEIEGFDVKYDPTRFLSLHCFLFPYFKFCSR